ncbi:MAG: 4Fe-4S binding protein [Sphaerochaetaceae bacterium]|nr:4Fe-4S binding protein [Sphaerochaetaceae bacterium]MDC7247555.1 4Fe-4S binding protein [Sphaerochaetaceae bacterium]
MKNLVKCDVQRCKGCYVCISHCPKGCLTIDSSINSQGYVPVSTVSEADCIGCGMCVLSCPEPFALKVIKENKDRVCKSA